MRNRNYRSQGTRKPRAQWEAATAPSIGAGHIGRRRSPPGEEESHPQSQAGASVEDNPSARPSSSSVPWPRPASPCSTRAILKIAEMEYSGANSIFLRAFLDKKYALPYHVVDAVFSHFVRFVADPRPLPVLWLAPEPAHVCAEAQGGHVPRAEGGAHGPGEGQDPPRDISRGETRAAPVQVQGPWGGSVCGQAQPFCTHCCHS